jgi:hypothetical protein
VTKRWVCRLQLLLAVAIAVILRSESRGTHDHILLSQIRDSPNLESQVPVFTYSRNRMARLYTKALGCLFVASYDSQSYGGGIRTRLHTGMFLEIYVQYRVDKSLPPDPNGNRMNTNRTFTPHLFNVRLNVSVSSMPEPYKWFSPSKFHP